MLLKIQYTSTVFAQIDVKQDQNTCFSSCLRFLWNKSRSSCFIFQTVENVSHSKPPPPGKKSWAKIRPPGSGKVRIPGGRPGRMVRLGIDWYIKYGFLPDFSFVGKICYILITINRWCQILISLVYWEFLNEVLRDERSETDTFLLCNSVKAMIRNQISLNRQSFNLTLNSTVQSRACQCSSVESALWIL